jgi:hypothetical protein
MSHHLAIAISGSVCTALLALTGCAASTPGSPSSTTPAATASSTSATSPAASSPAATSPVSANSGPTSTGGGYLTATISELVHNPALVVGGPPIQFTVILRNGTNHTYRDIIPLVSIGHCTCFSNEPVPVAPSGTLTEFDPATAGWRSVYYDEEGTGMDYILGNIVQQPPITLNPATSASFTFRIALTGRQPKPWLHAGRTLVDVTVVQLPGRTWIGNRPAASISVATIRL